MTEKEIVKALQCISTVCSATDRDCLKCGYFRKWFGCDADRLSTDAADLIERLTAENAALREKQRWIPVTERLPEERVLVNVVWVNRAPEPYYERIKNVPFSGTACFYRENWYWDSPVVLDLLAEYGEDEPDSVDEAVGITHWMPLPDAQKVADILRGAPEAPEEGGKA